MTEWDLLRSCMDNWKLASIVYRCKTFKSGWMNDNWDGINTLLSEYGYVEVDGRNEVWQALEKSGRKKETDYYVMFGKKTN